MRASFPGIAILVLVGAWSVPATAHHSSGL